MLRRIPIHPLLVAALPVVVLWVFNRNEVATRDALAVLWPALVATAVVSAVLALALRSLRRGALVGSAAAFLWLTYGYLWGQANLPAIGLLLLVGLVGYAGLRARRLDDEQAGLVTLVVNVATVIVVAVAAVPLVTATNAGAAAPDEVEDTPVAGDQPLRDIVYVIPDRYGAARSLQSNLGIDNTDMVEFLEERGFAVAEDATANYPSTSASLSSTLRMDYLDDVAADVPPDASADPAPLFELLRDHRLGEVLTGAGYQYVHVGSWWGPTATAEDADSVRTLTTASEFEQIFTDSTALPAVRSLLGIEGSTSFRDRVRDTSVFQLAELDRLLREDHDQPRFLMVHLTLPHEPYVFDADGSVVTEETEASRSRSENYRRQLDYLNDRLRGVVEVVSSGPDEDAPVVVLQADEGPHPERKELVEGEDYAWSTATDEELDVKFRILSAIRLPDVDAEAVLPEDLSAVNTWRIVLDTVLGTDLGPLPDRLYVHADQQHLYDFTEVTDRVRDG